MLMKPVSKCTDDDLYFKSEAEKLIFALVKLDGKTRMDILKINRFHYSNKKYAKQWSDNIFNIIKNSEHPHINLALQKLDKLYYEMIKN